MSFAAPGWLALLAAVAGLAAAYLVAQRRRPAYAMRFTNVALLGVLLPRRPRWRRHVAAALMALGLVALVLALARPVSTEEVGVARGTVVLAVDVSLSMAADDVAPTRLDAAKQAALAFLDEAPADISLGLVTFAETAQVDLAPSPDRAPLRRAVASMRLRPGTGIGEAIFASLDALAAVGAIEPPARPGDPSAAPSTARPSTAGAAPARIVVMSDGETTAGRTNAQATQAAARAGVPVWTIAFGTTGGTIAYGGQTVQVPTNASALAEVAEATGGLSFTAATEAELFAVFTDVAVTVDTEEVERDLAPWFTAGGLALVAAAGVLSLAWFQRLV